MVTKNVAKVVHLAAEIALLKARPKSKDLEQVEEDEDAFEIKTGQLKKVINENVKLQAFFKLVNAQWNDIERQKHWLH